MKDNYQHISVLADEIVDFFRPQSNQNFVDCTLGGGGHSQRILEKTGPRGKILAFEMDNRAIVAAKKKLSKYQDRIDIVNKSYVHLESEIKGHKFTDISGIILDLGLSSDQLDKADRGFSFKDHGPLDMRFDPAGQTLTASDIILTWPVEKLEKIFREYGEVKQPRRLAKGLVLWRKTLDPEYAPKGTTGHGKQKQKPIKTSMLVDAILRILKIYDPKGSTKIKNNLPRLTRVKAGRKTYRIHPATQIFQSLRIAVNDELRNLQSVLPQAVKVLPKSGRLAVISFHSLEDRITKHFFKDLAKPCDCPPDVPVCVCNKKPSIKILTTKAIKPSAQEIEANPRSRSAILRVIEKI